MALRDQLEGLVREYTESYSLVEDGMALDGGAIDRLSKALREHPYAVVAMLRYLAPEDVMSARERYYADAQASRAGAVTS